MVMVLLAAYEGSAYIKDQLDSILGQTVEDLCIMASDDGSTDGTREILEQYAEEFPDKILIRNHSCRENPMAVPPAARNFFWMLSREEAGQAEYIMLSDQDDVWKPEKTEKLQGRMRELEAEFGTEHPILVHSDMKVVDQDLKQIAPSFFAYEKCDPKRTAFAQVLIENPVTGGAIMMNRAMADLFRESPSACFMHDWWMALVASCFGTISCVEEPLYLYRQHGKNTLGAKETGSIQDLKERAGRQNQVEENYRKIFAQAAAFGRQYGKKMDEGQRSVLRSFLALPLQSPAGRFRNICRNHFYKSSRIQTLAMCLTIPRAEEF